VDKDTAIFEKINDLVERMNVNRNLEVALEIDDYLGQSNQDLQLVVYRIIQEQFSNIVNYAQASKANIRVYKKLGHLGVAIKDDGIGFDLSKKTTGIGLQNIRRRVQVLGGNVRIQSSPGKGFALTASIPL
jgi:signal transduction histidine kinase